MTLRAISWNGSRTRQQTGYVADPLRIPTKSDTSICWFESKHPADSKIPFVM